MSLFSFVSARAAMALGAVTALGCVSLQASPPQGESVIVSLPDRAAVAEAAARSNPQLRAARWSIERARGRTEQSGLLPNPELGLSAMSDVLFSSEGEYAYSVSLSQAFPLSARLRYERHVTEAQLLAAQAEVEQQRQSVALRAVELWRDAVEAAERVRLLTAQEALAQSLLDFTRAAAARGERSALDADVAELEVLSLRSRLLQERRGAEQSRLALRAELGAPVSAAIELPQPQPLPPAKAGPEAEQWNGANVNIEGLAAVRGAAAQVAATEAELKRARAERYGDITVSLQYEQGRAEDFPMGMKMDRMIGLAVSVPLPVWNTYSGNIAEQTAARREADARLSAERYLAQQSLYASGSEAASAYAACRDVQDGLLPALRQSVTRIEEGVARGEVELPELLRARTSLIGAELESLRLLMNYHRAVDRFTAAAGNLLQNQ